MITALWVLIILMIAYTGVSLINAILTGIASLVLELIPGIQALREKKRAIDPAKMGFR